MFSGRIVYVFGPLQLLNVLLEIPAMVMISSYPCRLYETWLRGWRRFEFQAMTRGGPRTEVIWMNCLRGGSHWASFAGVNFTDRQRIKRRQRAGQRIMESAKKSGVESHRRGKSATVSFNRLILRGILRAVRPSAADTGPPTFWRSPIWPPTHCLA